MNNVLELKGLKFDQKKNFVTPGRPKLPVGAKIKKRDLYSLLENFREMLKYWKNETLIDGALISVYYKGIVAKSNRIKGFFEQGQKTENSTIVGAQFTRGNIKKHIITHYVELKSIEKAIDRLETSINILEENSLIIITENELMNLYEKQNFKKFNISKSNFAKLIVSMNYIEKIGRLINENQNTKNQIVSIYNTGQDTVELLKKLEIETINRRVIDNTTILLSPKNFSILQRKAPYLISMATSDLSNFSKVDFSGLTETKLTISSPLNEPTIGVIDTLFDKNVYFSEWVEYQNMLDKDIPVNSDDYTHGTAVSSIIVDGPALNPWLDDGCGNFKVRHFGVATRTFFSSFSVLQSIRKIIKENTDIKVWNLSLGSTDEINPNFISIEASILDEIQHENDVIFIIAGTNKEKKHYQVERKIGAPADSINSLIVNSVDLGKKPAPYSRDGIVLSFFNKPDVSYYGGTSDKLIKVCQPLGVGNVKGTSFAAPWISRKMSYLIDVLGLRREVAKALIIDSANEWGKNYTAKETSLLGHGVVPIDIENVIKSEKDEIKFILSGSSEKFDTYNFDIPMPIDSKGKYPYNVKATLCYFPKCSRNQGVDYTDTEIDIQFGRITDKDKLNPFNKNKQNLEEISYLHENNARKIFRKWDNSKHIQEEIKKTPRGKKVYPNRLWGLSLKTKERLEKKSGIGLKFGIIITFKEIKGVNRIDDFIKRCKYRGWLVNELDLKNKIDIYNIAHEEITFD